MKILENIKLAPYTTFKIGGAAKYFCEVKDQFDALTAFEFAKEKSLPVFILGGGSNLLIADSGFSGLVIRVVNRGIEMLVEEKNDSPDEILLKVASGENWDSVVDFAVKNNWWGMENLSHIPGSTGAIAVQNVGAYGQEAKNLIESVTVFDKQTHQILSLNKTDCGFSYRRSIFNSTEKGRYIIFEILFRLSKNPLPILNYRDLAQKFANIKPSLLEIRHAIIEIRNKKFPFPTQAKKGNAGSFFKNIILNQEEFLVLKNRLQKEFGQEAAEKLEQKKFTEANSIKVPTAFLLDICGLKDFAFGGAAINKNQPLVIINQTGKATASDVLNLAKQVKKTAQEKLGINIHIEPELIGFSDSDLKELV
jgi:UDP-N-acetylmuramate dehydrogenase